MNSRLGPTTTDSALPARPWVNFGIYTEVIQAGNPVHGVVCPGYPHFLADLFDFAVGLEYNLR